MCSRSLRAVTSVCNSVSLATRSRRTCVPAWRLWYRRLLSESGLCPPPAHTRTTNYRRGTTMSEKRPAPSSDDRLVLTERDRRLLDQVGRFRLVSRDQAMALAPFGSLTRANTRLARLVQARLLARK